MTDDERDEVTRLLAYVVGVTVGSVNFSANDQVLRLCEAAVERDGVDRPMLHDEANLLIDYATLRIAILLARPAENRREE